MHIRKGVQNNGEKIKHMKDEVPAIKHPKMSLWWRELAEEFHSKLVPDLPEHYLCVVAVQRNLSNANGSITQDQIKMPASFLFRSSFLGRA